MVLNHIICHGLFYGLVFNLYLFIMMVTLNPRIWGYSDYPDIIKQKVPGQTKKEKMVALLVGLPWIIFVMVFPIFSTLMLKAKLAGDISLIQAFLNLLALVAVANVGDLVILDWLIISKITPRFVIIPGSDVKDYKDFSHHYKAHARSAIILIPLCFILAVVITCLI